MGTNYYLTFNECDCCKRMDKIHIGKSSAGWYFSLHVTDELNSLDKWIETFKEAGTHIVNEYDDLLSTYDMVKKITERGQEKAPNLSVAELIYNGATLGMNNLLKPSIGTHCVGYADDLPVAYIKEGFS